jgi:branched-chain amino acid transport system substrate-binding protein
VRDEYAGGFLVSKTLQRGHERIGLLLERTAWGRSNEKAILEALAKAGKTPAAVEWLNWGERNLTAQVNRLHEADVEAVLLVCNCLEGASAVKAIADLPLESRPVVVSHWGISAGSFFDLVSEQLKTVDVSFLQTFSFVASKRPVEARTVFEAYRHRFDDCNTPEDIFSPVGTAHAYEIVLMLATAVRNAGSIETEQVHQALEAISDYEGLIRHYQRPFPPGHHDALTADDFNLAEFDNQGTIRPVQ